MSYVIVFQNPDNPVFGPFWSEDEAKAYLATLRQEDGAGARVVPLRQPENVDLATARAVVRRMDGGSVRDQILELRRLCGTGLGQSKELIATARAERAAKTVPV